MGAQQEETAAHSMSQEKPKADSLQKVGVQGERGERAESSPSIVDVNGCCLVFIMIYRTWLGTLIRIRKWILEEIAKKFKLIASKKGLRDGQGINWFSL